MNYPGFVGGSYQSQSPLSDNERTINWYPETVEDADSTTRMALYPTPGVTLLSTAAQGPGLAHFAQAGREYAVIGTTFYEIDAFGALTSRGTVALGIYPATISSNGQAGGQLMITAGLNVYIFTPATNAFVQVAAMNGQAYVGDQLDGYFLVMNSATSTVYFSNLSDGLTWQTGINFFRRNIAPDPWVTMKVANRFIWLFGSQTTELWWDAGYFPVPFVPYVSSIIPYGCFSLSSPVVADGVVAWLGTTKEGQNIALRGSGVKATPITTYALANVMAGYPKVSDAVADAYTSRGHTFFLFNFPTANQTLCYDSNMSLWHERGTWISEQNIYSAWRPRFHAFAFGQHRMLDASTGAVYQMDETLGSDVDSRPIRRLRQAPTLFHDNQRLFVDSFELAMEPGLGNTVDPGSNPQAMLRISPDGGKTWGNERMRSAGALGQYSTRAIWNRCGMARRATYQVSVTDSIPWRVMGAFVKMRQPPAGMSQYEQAQWQN